MSKARGPVLMPEFNKEELAALLVGAKTWVSLSVPQPQADTLITHLDGALRLLESDNLQVISGKVLLEYIEQLEKYIYLLSDFIKVSISAAAFKKEGAADV